MIVIAGLADIQLRPPEKISGPQATALAFTGVIWARYATQITPVNYNLLAVNVFVGSTGLYQIYIRQKAVQDGRIQSFWSSSPTDGAGAAGARALAASSGDIGRGSSGGGH
jgi:hypothetical protein